jgi:hypothetical protein
MDIVDEYRQFADECLRWARDAKTADERQAFLTVANAWVLAADRCAGSTPSGALPLALERPDGPGPTLAAGRS